MEEKNIALVTDEIQSDINNLSDEEMALYELVKKTMEEKEKSSSHTRIPQELPWE